MVIWVVLAIFLPLLVEAKSLKDVSIRISTDIIKDCSYIGDSVKGCYYSPSKGSRATIYLSAYLNIQEIRVAFLHEIGHYLMDGTSEETYNKLFGSAFGYYVKKEYIQEYATNAFVYWWITNKATQAQDKFFINLFR